MAESQEEKIKKIFANKDIKIKDILDKMFPQGKGSYYNEVRKPKLSPSFIEGINKHFGVDLVKELAKYGQEGEEDIVSLKKEIDRLRKLVTDLQAELLEIYKKK